MVKAEFLLENKIKDCANCPLKNSLTHNCGRVYSENYNGAIVYRKKPLKCKLHYRLVKLKDERVQ